MYSSFGKFFIPGILVSILLLIAGLFLYDVHSASLFELQDPYVVASQGKVVVIRDSKPQVLSVDESFLLQEKDTVKTLDSAFATIFWQDGSVTRLDQKSEIIIQSLQTNSQNYSFQVDIQLKKGKSWSNILRYLGQDSSFQQRFQGGEGEVVATVRGTIFEVNLDDQYVSTSKHAVTLKDQKNTVDLLQGQAVSTQSILDYLNSEILNKAWGKFNEVADNKYIQNQLELLDKKVQASLENSSILDKIIRYLRSFIGISNGDIDLYKTTENILKNKNVSPEILKELSQGNYQSLLNQYRAIEPFLSNKESIQSLDSLRSVLVESAPEDVKTGLIQDFSLRSYLDAKLFQSVSQSFDTYLESEQGKSIVDSLKKSFESESVRKASEISDDLKGGLLEGAKKINSGVDDLAEQGKKTLNNLLQTVGQ